ncbi:ABC transporter ATP-binding protein, partial [Chloroflexota bacterium]
MKSLKVENLTFGYGTKSVLADVNLEIFPGQLTGIIGPNGCGKSTIIKAISRVINIRSGRITFDSRNITTIPRKEFAGIISVVPQIPLLPSAYTAFEIVLMGRNPHLGFLQNEGQHDYEIAWHAMEITATEHLAQRRINELSGGEIQCLLIARALTQQT